MGRLGEREMNERVASMVESIGEDLTGHLGRKVASHCASPIEQLFCLGLLYFSGHVVPIGAPGSILFYVYPQMSLTTKEGTFRVDFLISARHWDWIGLGEGQVVIECDGHDFHEKTKEQAARDKRRDRALQAAGYRVIRFTGSEIWADAVMCAWEAVQVLVCATPSMPSWLKKSVNESYTTVFGDSTEQADTDGQGRTPGA